MLKRQGVVALPGLESTGGCILDEVVKNRRPDGRPLTASEG